MPTKNPTDILLCRWLETLAEFQVDEIAAKNAFNSLVDAYSTGDRIYHTLKHIRHVLSTIDILQVYAQDLGAVQLAAWFHDIVYDTQAQDNEEKSAEYAEELLTKLGIPLNIIATVTRLILHTKHHQAPADDFNSQVLLDADLAILAANTVAYWEYAHAIRQEYAWVSAADYIAGRTRVLKKILQRDRIYFTPLMFAIAEQSARSHLVAEIELLNHEI
jgi:predicted metal-dependent HD superfamily phosphohydrolase